MNESAKRRTHLIGTLLPLLLIGAYAVYAVAVNFVADDGYIGLRYVQSLFRGDGLVYNAGERVEGYTNFLFLIGVALLHALAPSIDMMRDAQALALGAGGLSIWLVCRYCRRELGELGWPSLLPGACLAVHSSFVAWSTSGLETVFFAALVTLATFSYVRFLGSGRQFMRVPLLFCLVCMTRPDGVVPFAVTSLHFAVWQWRNDRTRLWRSVIGWALCFLIPFGIYYATRYSYYGTFFPNTFYAKVGGAPGLWRVGLTYLRNYFVIHGVFVFLPTLYALFVRPRSLQRDYLALVVLGYLTYIVYVGGDGLGFFRFVAHVAPLLYVLAADGLFELRKTLAARLPRAAVSGFTIVFVLATLAFTTRQTAGRLLWPAQFGGLEPHSELTFPAPDGSHPYLWFDTYFVERQRQAAEWLDQHLPEGSLVASTPAGAIAYFMHHRVIDMLGLNDAHIARTEPGHVGFFRPGHMKGDGKYVLSRRPEAILLGNVAVLSFPLSDATMPRKLIRKSEHELWEDPEFHRDYELVVVRLHAQGPFQYFSFYKRRDVVLQAHALRGFRDGFARERVAVCVPVAVVGKVGQATFRCGRG